MPMTEFICPDEHRIPMEEAAVKEMKEICKDRIKGLICAAIPGCPLENAEKLARGIVQFIEKVYLEGYRQAQEEVRDWYTPKPDFD